MRLRTETAGKRWILLRAAGAERAAHEDFVPYDPAVPDAVSGESSCSSGVRQKGYCIESGTTSFCGGKYMEQAKRFRMGQLRGVMEDGADTEQRVKTGLLTDHLAVELFIVKHSGDSSDPR